MFHEEENYSEISDITFTQGPPSDDVMGVIAGSHPSYRNEVMKFLDRQINKGGGGVGRWGGGAWGCRVK